MACFTIHTQKKINKIYFEYLQHFTLQKCLQQLIFMIKIMISKIYVIFISRFVYETVQLRISNLYTTSSKWNKWNKKINFMYTHAQIK